MNIDDKFTIDELLKNSWNKRDSKEFIKFFDFIARFNHYSHFNTMMVYLQNPEVTFFGSPSFWKNKFNRYVKITEDTKPYVILAPMCPIMLVYDVFDTEGNLTPQEFLNSGLGHAPFEVKGILPKGILETICNKAKLLGIVVKFVPLSYFKAGFINTKAINSKVEIRLSENKTGEENLATLFHELAHLFLGHTDITQVNLDNKSKPIIIKNRKLTIATEELEAEAVSFLLCKKLNLETRSADYMAGYIDSEKEIINFSYEQVIKVADKIEGLFLQKIMEQYRNKVNIPVEKEQSKGDLFSLPLSW